MEANEKTKTWKKVWDFGINGYGTPLDPLQDKNLERYLTQVLRHVENHPDEGFFLYPCGGWTNDESISEAQAIGLWFSAQKNLPENILGITLIEPTSKTAMMKENMITFRERSEYEHNKLYACEYSRRYSAHFLLPRVMSFCERPSLYWEFGVLPIVFDQSSMTEKHQLW